MESVSLRNLKLTFKVTQIDSVRDPGVTNGFHHFRNGDAVENLPGLNTILARDSLM